MAQSGGERERNGAPRRGRTATEGYVLPAMTGETAARDVRAMETSERMARLALPFLCAICRRRLPGDDRDDCWWRCSVCRARSLWSDDEAADSPAWWGFHRVCIETTTCVPAMASSCWVCEEGKDATATTGADGGGNATVPLRSTPAPEYALLSVKWRPSKGRDHRADE